MCIRFSSFDRCYMILPWNLHSIDIFCFIYRLLGWFFKVIYNLHIQGSKFGRKFDKFGRFFFLLELCGVYWVCFFLVWLPIFFKIWGGATTCKVWYQHNIKSLKKKLRVDQRLIITKIYSLLLEPTSNSYGGLWSRLVLPYRQKKSFSHCLCNF